MIQSAKRQTKFGLIYWCIDIIFLTIVDIFVIMMPNISFYIFIKLFFICAFTFLVVTNIKNELIPLIMHIIRDSFEGELIIGKVDTNKIRFTGDRFFSGYTIEGFYIVDDSTYVFKDHFYYNDFRAEICFQKLFKAEKIPEDIAILIDPLNPAKHKVRGIEWLAGVRESFPEYFE